MLSSILLLSIIGATAAALLYVASRRFHIPEDPRVAEAEALLPGANCGGCGYSGCHAFAEACAKASSLADLHCVAMPAEEMVDVARVLGLDPGEISDKKTAIVKCSNDCDTRDRRNIYDGVRSCAAENALYQGESECLYGCLGCGDCVNQCRFGAISIPPEIWIPVVDFEKCVACGACVAACPRHIIEIVGYPEVAHPFTFVACNNKDRGPEAMKACKVSCIGCGICKKVCEHSAVTVTDFLATIDQDLCVGCGECAAKCPRHTIVISEEQTRN